MPPGHACARAPGASWWRRVQREITPRLHRRPILRQRALLDRIDQLSLATSGTFWHASGDVLPW